MKMRKNIYIIEKDIVLVRSVFKMIFKVYFQEKMNEVPVREKTKTIYLEGVSKRDVRTKLADRGYNIEFVQPVTGAYLEYEKQNEDFKVLEI